MTGTGGQLGWNTQVGPVEYVFEATAFYSDPENGKRMLEFVKPKYVVMSTEEKEATQKVRDRNYLADQQKRGALQIRTQAKESPLLDSSKRLLEKLKR